MIPKIIHYVWVGNGQQDETIRKCLQSWQQYLPDYQIMVWDDAALVKVGNQYAKEAFAAKKWAFVSDYLRVYALYHYGGFYFDTDLEVLKSFEDFLDKKLVIGFEQSKKGFVTGTACVGSMPGQPLIKAVLASYEGRSFFRQDGKLDLTTNLHAFMACYTKQYAIRFPHSKSETLELEPGVLIYPHDYFSQFSGDRTYARHHFLDSWGADFKKQYSFNIFPGYYVVLYKKRRAAIAALPQPDEDENIIWQKKVKANKTVALIKKVDKR